MRGLISKQRWIKGLTLVLCLFLLGMPGPVLSLSPVHYMSIEYLAYESDLIVVGRVATLTDIQPGIEYKGGWRQKLVGIDVDQTLKGQKQSNLMAVLDAV